MKSEVSKAITDEEFIDAVVNHRNRLIHEKTRLIKELSSTKPEESEEVYAVVLVCIRIRNSIGLKKSLESTLPTTRFYVSERDYQIVSKTGKGIVMFVVPDKGKHPEGTYDIPHDVIMRFFESKRQGYNWKKHKNFNQDGIPSLFSQYFHPFSD